MHNLDIQSISADRVTGFAKSFLNAKGEAISCFLKVGRIVSQAHSELSPSEFKTFVVDAQVGSNSTVKKLRAIGRMCDLFEAHISQLPPNWTSLYKLTRIPPEDLLALFQKGVINPQIEGKQIDAYVPNNQRSLPRDESSSDDYEVKLPHDPDGQVKILFAEFRHKLEPLGVKFRRLRHEELVLAA